MIDPKKKYTYDDKPVRILATDLKSCSPIAAAIDYGGYEDLVCCTEADLTEVKPEIEGWLNVYTVHKTKEAASRYAADLRIIDSRLACIPVTFREGDGLERGK